MANRHKRAFQQACREAARDGYGFNAQGVRTRLDPSKEPDRCLMAGYRVGPYERRSRRSQSETRKGAH